MKSLILNGILTRKRDSRSKCHRTLQAFLLFFFFFKGKVHIESSANGICSAAKRRYVNTSGLQQRNKKTPKRGAAGGGETGQLMADYRKLKFSSFFYCLCGLLRGALLLVNQITIFNH